MNSIPPLQTILSEVRIRLLWIGLGIVLTWFTCYSFSEELLFLLASPFLNLNIDAYFLCTELTEAFSTFLATASIACSYFVFPFICYHIWCFLIPSCYSAQRNKYTRLIHLSAVSFFVFLFVTHSWFIPALWHFLLGATSTNSLTINFQPKIYDHLILTVRIFFITSLCSQVPLILISLIEQRTLCLETFTNNRRFCLLFTLLTAALSTPPDISCQISAWFVLSLVTELAIFGAFILQVRESRTTYMT